MGIDEENSAPKKRSHLFYLYTAVISVTLIIPGSARTYYVAPNGSNSASGTISQPLATIQRANDLVAAGDTVFIRGGTYKIAIPANSGAGIAITKSGSSNSKRIYFWAYPDETPVFDFVKPADGNGNGFKIGSSKTGIRHIVKNCVAWKNKAAGFYANHSAGGNTWYNNTAYSNGTSFNLLASTWDAAGNRTDGVILTGSKVHIMRNNIGFPNKNINMNGVDSKFNTWDLNITPVNKDFLSVTDPSMTVTGQDLSKSQGALGPRPKNGDLPNIDFLKLASGSEMIDKGIDVGLPAIRLPDLGAYEFGATTGILYNVLSNGGSASNSKEKRGYQQLKRFDIAGRQFSGVKNVCKAHYIIYTNLNVNSIMVVLNAVPVLNDK